MLQPRAPLRWLYRILAYAFLGLAVVGILLPGLPTVPFLLLAAWAASRGSDRLHQWIERHRHFGPMLRAWQEHRAIPVRAKWVAVMLLGVSWLALNWGAEAPAVPLLTGVGFIAVALFLLTRPSARSALAEEVARD